MVLKELSKFEAFKVLIDGNAKFTAGFNDKDKTEAKIYVTPGWHAIEIAVESTYVSHG